MAKRVIGIMRFIVTKELGRLARWLRIAGFDTIYFTVEKKATLSLTALRDNRIIITRSKEKTDYLEKQTVMIKSNKLEEQLKEVIARLKLKIDEKTMFTRCTLCNEILEDVGKESIKDAVPEYVYQHQEHFMKCPKCEKIYWKGSHWGHVKEVLELCGL